MHSVHAKKVQVLGKKTERSRKAASNRKRWVRDDCHTSETPKRERLRAAGKKAGIRQAHQRDIIADDAIAESVEDLLRTEKKKK